MTSDGNALRVEFPDFPCSLLQKLNQQRQRGQLCDVTVVIQGHQYRAHRAVLAASSPYFCDQVLLKNSARVVLPDVMQPLVFERLLHSCYTGTLVLPAGEVVAFLTAASFLQMWHVVDKCTELLEVGGCTGNVEQKSKKGLGTLACNKRAEGKPSPGDSSYHSPGDVDMLLDSCTGGSVDNFAKIEMEQLLENSSFSPPALDPDAQACGSCSSPVEPECSGSEVTSQNGEEEGDGEYLHTRPAYVPPSIMGHRKWLHVKAERPERDNCGGLFCEAGPDIGHFNFDRSQASTSRGSFADSIDEKLVAQLEETLDGEQTYEDPLDFYGTSLDGFSAGKCEINILSPKEELEAAIGECKDDEPTRRQTASGHQDETSHSGFASVVYKLYPCQCGKSFTHKSQRDRHMSMHLGLRPFCCTVCSKSFKMKHHLVGHMKIHTGIKPYECRLCSKKFMWRDSFNRHISSCSKTHHARQGVTDQSMP
ncbi:zinc finger and BTB domain-containing protein 43 isoform X1 [Myripristis murdjan]|uniref:zinc finger and BTB domain-containing protein 43 isoform X1 n=1 Tax=Myripristis murdjan TaxID=586833 RepID=UPI0011761765|nr:zinc finger and BTB domain-containing protein 43 isoform X1 [Myripristis murdjan]